MAHLIDNVNVRAPKADPLLAKSPSLLFIYFFFFFENELLDELTLIEGYPSQMQVPASALLSSSDFVTSFSVNERD